MCAMWFKKITTSPFWRTFNFSIGVISAKTRKRYDSCIYKDVASLVLFPVILHSSCDISTFHHSTFDISSFDSLTFDSSTIRQFDSSTFRQFDSSTIRHFDIHHFDNSTFHHSTFIISNFRKSTALPQIKSSVANYMAMYFKKNHDTRFGEPSISRLASFRPKPGNDTIPVSTKMSHLWCYFQLFNIHHSTFHHSTFRRFDIHHHFKFP